jgi:hypothetical protein
MHGEVTDWLKHHPTADAANILFQMMLAHFLFQTCILHHSEVMPHEVRLHLCDHCSVRSIKIWLILHVCDLEITL